MKIEIEIKGFRVKRDGEEIILEDPTDSENYVILSEVVEDLNEVLEDYLSDFDAEVKFEVKP